MRTQLEPKGGEVVIYMDDVRFAMLDLSDEAVQAMTFLKGEPLL